MMSRLRVHGFSLSLDRFGAGLTRALDNPLGEGSPTGVDDDLIARGFTNIGAGTRISMY
jgi:hypothetical protein